jgi:hypothetical protein
VRKRGDGGFSAPRWETKGSTNPAVIVGGGGNPPGPEAEPDSVLASNLSNVPLWRAFLASRWLSLPQLRYFPWT